MKNQNTLLLVGAAVIGYILYKRYTTTVTANTSQIVNPNSAAAVLAAGQLPGLAQPNFNPPTPIQAPAVIPTQGSALTFDQIQNF
jgi:hypothetical protein